MSNRKEKHNEWHVALVYYLAKIIFCERCRKRRATDHAHRIKRRFIGWRRDGEEGRSDLDKREYFMAAKLCRACHTDLDEYKGPGSHERMFLIITRIAVTRPRARVQGEYQELHPLRLWEPEKIYNYER